MPAAENHLIERLTRNGRTRLRALAEPMPLVLSAVLCESQQPTQHVYFPVDGFISLVTTIEDHPGLEVGMVGREGMLGVQLVLGVGVVPTRALVQGPGSAWRIGAAPFRKMLAGSPALQKMLQRYVYVQMAPPTRGCRAFSARISRSASTSSAASAGSVIASASAQSVSSAYCASSSGLAR